MAALLGQLSQLPGIRAAVDAGTNQPLVAFQAYNNVVNASFPFSLGALANPAASIPFYQLSQGVGDEAQALEFVGREAALVGGALASGGRMSPAEHQLFVQAVTVTSSCSACSSSAGPGSPRSSSPPSCCSGSVIASPAS